MNTYLMNVIEVNKTVLAVQTRATGILSWRTQWHQTHYCIYLITKRSVLTLKGTGEPLYKFLNMSTTSSNFFLLPVTKTISFFDMLWCTYAIRHRRPVNNNNKIKLSSTYVTVPVDPRQLFRIFRRRQAINSCPRFMFV